MFAIRGQRRIFLALQTLFFRRFVWFSGYLHPPPSHTAFSLHILSGYMYSSISAEDVFREGKAFSTPPFSFFFKLHGRKIFNVFTPLMEILCPPVTMSAIYQTNGATSTVLGSTNENVTFQVTQRKIWPILETYIFSESRNYWDLSLLSSY